MISGTNCESTQSWENRVYGYLTDNGIVEQARLILVGKQVSDNVRRIVRHRLKSIDSRLYRRFVMFG